MLAQSVKIVAHRQRLSRKNVANRNFFRVTTCASLRFRFRLLVRSRRCVSHKMSVRFANQMLTSMMINIIRDHLWRRVFTCTKHFFVCENAILQYLYHERVCAHARTLYTPFAELVTGIAARFCPAVHRQRTAQTSLYIYVDETRITRTPWGLYPVNTQQHTVVYGADRAYAACPRKPGGDGLSQAAWKRAVDLLQRFISARFIHSHNTKKSDFVRKLAFSSGAERAVQRRLVLRSR